MPSHLHMRFSGARAADHVPTLAEQIGKIIDVAMTLEKVAAVEHRSVEVSDALHDGLASVGEQFRRLGRGARAS